MFHSVRKANCLILLVNKTVGLSIKMMFCLLIDITQKQKLQTTRIRL